MAHGRPDYNITNAPTTTYQVSDMGELAARLESINTYDRRGDTVWMDDFEPALLRWTTSALGTGVAPVRNTLWARSGTACAFGQVGAGVGSTTMQHAFYFPQAARLGFEISGFDSLSMGFLEMRALIRYQGQEHSAGVRFDSTTRVLEYQTGVGVYAQIAANQPCVDFLHGWNTLKFVVDCDTWDFVRVIWNGNEFDMTGIPTFVSGAAVFDSIIVFVIGTSDGVNASNFYWDDFIFTQNEP